MSQGPLQRPPSARYSGASVRYSGASVRYSGVSSFPPEACLPPSSMVKLRSKSWVSWFA